MRRHRNEKPFECNVCGKSFVIKFELIRTITSIEGAYEYTYQSDYGQKSNANSISKTTSQLKIQKTLSMFTNSEG